MMAVEYRVCQESAAAHQRRRDTFFGAGFECIERRQRLAEREDIPQRFHIRTRAGFIQRNADAAIVDQPQVDRLAARSRVDILGMAAGMHGDGVEEAGGWHRMVQQAQALGQDCGQPVYPLCDRLQALRTVVNRVHAGDVGQQYLCGTDVAGGFLTADMLFAGLHRQAVGRLAAAVDRDTDQSSRHHALVRIQRGEIRRVRTTVTERHAETLGAAHHHIGAELAWRRQQGQCQQIGGNHD